jgi:hypothetical protein
MASILGEVDGIVSVGELRWLWRRGLLERRSCGCGLPPGECPVWSQVVAGVLEGGPEAATEVAARVVAAQDVLAARRNRLRAIRSAARAEPAWEPLQRVREMTARLIRGIAEVTGAHIVVDSSKRASDAAVLASLPDVEHYVLHVVRDPGAVAHSWQRRDKTIRVAGGTRAMATRQHLASAVRWTESCLSAEVLRRQVPADRWMFLRYEDFAAAPRASVSAILEFLGEAARPPFVADDAVVLGVNHTVAGNPNRFRTGPVTVRVDDEWRSSMPRRRQWEIRAVTWPFLRRYGYPLGVAARVDAARDRTAHRVLRTGAAVRRNPPEVRTGR